MKNDSKSATVKLIAAHKTALTADKLFDRPFPEAEEWARKYAVEFFDSGEAEPVPRFLRLMWDDYNNLLRRLSDEKRIMLRQSITQGMIDNLSYRQIAALIQADYAFSEASANLIASTEIGNANCHGQYIAYRRAGLKSKKWLLSNDEGVCSICEVNADRKSVV